MQLSSSTMSGCHKEAQGAELKQQPASAFTLPSTRAEISFLRQERKIEIVSLTETQTTQRDESKLAKVLWCKRTKKVTPAFPSVH